VMDGINNVFGALEDGQISAEQTISFLQQMLAIDMPLDKENKERRYAELPTETREAYEATRGGGLPPNLVALLEAFGAGPDGVFEL